MLLKRIIPALLAVLTASVHSQAQTPDSTFLLRLTTENVWAAVGHHHSYDTYLSNLLYQGTQLGLGFEQQRLYSAKWPKMSKYDGASLKMAFDHNYAGNHTLLTPQVRGFYGAHYHLPEMGRLNTLVGAYTNWDLGVKYLPHNGNNPANVIANSQLWLSGMLSYKFHVGCCPIRIADHFSMVALGVMFSPYYTQLYYDISAIEGIDGHAVCTSFGNRVQFRNEFSVDVPLGLRATVRLGFVAERLRYDVSQLEGRNLECLAKVGVVRNFYTFRGKEPIPNTFITTEQ